MKAEIALEYDDARIAEAIADAVSPDNRGLGAGLLVETTAEGAKLVSNVKCSENLPTLIATIDDLLFSVGTAEKTVIQTVKTCSGRPIDRRVSCTHSRESL